MILSLIYQPLTTINKDGEVKGALAKRWYSYYDKRDDEHPHKMFIELKETAWSDGIQVTAQDFVYAWKRILSPEMQSPYASLLFPIKNAKEFKSGEKTSDDVGLTAESETLLCITFEKEYDINLFAEALSCIALSPLRENLIVKAMRDNPKGSDKYNRDQDWDKNAAIMVCNGPYKVQGYEEGTKLVLERNQFYYRDPEEDYLDESVVPYRLTCIYQETTIIGDVANPIDEYTFQYNKYLADKCYFLGSFSPETYKNLQGKLRTNRLLSTYSYYFNTKSEVLSDAKARQALSVALDRTEIANLLGTGMIPVTGFVPSGVFDKKPGSDFRKAGGDIYSTTADTNKAKSLLQEAGVSGGTLKLYYLIPWAANIYENSEKHKDVVDKITHYNPYEEIAKYAKQVWEGLGFIVELKGINAEKYLDELSKGEWDVFGIDYAINSADAFAWLAPFATAFSGNEVSVTLEAATYTPHYTGLEDTDYDNLIDSIVYVSDRNQRTEVLHQAEAKLAELCPATALFQYTKSYVVSSRLDNVEVTGWYKFFDFTDLRLDDYIEVNSREIKESLEAAEYAASYEEAHATSGESN